jgi:hypothetical protein
MLIESVASLFDRRTYGLNITRSNCKSGFSDCIVDVDRRAFKLDGLHAAKDHGIEFAGEVGVGLVSDTRGNLVSAFSAVNCQLIEEPLLPRQRS